MVSRILIGLAFLISACSSGNVPREQVEKVIADARRLTHEGDEYVAIPYEELVSSGFNGHLLFHDSPSAYTGMKVVTAGWLPSCGITARYLSEPKFEWTANMALINLDWEYLNSEALEAERLKCLFELEKFNQENPERATSPGSRPRDALFLVFGTIRSNSMGTGFECEDNVRLCNRLEVHAIQFQNAFRSTNGYFSGVVASSIEQGGPVLLDFLIDRAIGRAVAN